MSKTNFQELLDAGVHFGHLKRKWNPAMAPYIFMERNGIHIIDLHKTAVKIDEAANAIRQIIRSGKKVLFVATKKQAKDIIAEKAASVNMPYVVERWPGGMLTNFPTIRKAVKKMASIDSLMGEASWKNLSKREKLQITRQRAKLEKNLGSIADLIRLPAAMFVVDVMKENIAVREANRLNIPVFGIVDTNSDPTNIDFVIPANDDASKSIELIISVMVDAIKEGYSERKVDKDAEPTEQKDGERTSPKLKKGEIRARLKARKEAEAAAAGASGADQKEKFAEKPYFKKEVESEIVVEKTVEQEETIEKAEIQEAITTEVIEVETIAQEVVEQETVVTETVEVETITPEPVEVEAIAPESVEQETIAPEPVEVETVAEIVVASKKEKTTKTVKAPTKTPAKKAATPKVKKEKE